MKPCIQNPSNSSFFLAKDLYLYRIITRQDNLETDVSHTTDKKQRFCCLSKTKAIATAKDTSEDKLFKTRS